MLRILAYAVRRAGKRLWAAPGLTAAASLAIAIVVSMAAVAYLAAAHVQAWSGGVGGGAQMVVYLDADVDAARATGIASALRQLGGVESAQLIGQDEAYARVQQVVGENDELLAGLESSLFPASIEVSFAPGVRDVLEASPLLTQIRALAGVEEVEVVAGWAERTTGMLATVTRIAWFGFSLLGLSCAFMVAVAVRLRARERRLESAVLSLLGAPTGYSRALGAVEGGLQALIGGVLAVGLAYLAFRETAPPLARALGGVFGQLDVSFLSIAQATMLVGAAVAMGLVGGATGALRHGR